MFNLVNRARKKNNKGFSLVELIVVVLIIAIIAVALAPQVMKYVGKASENTDKNNAATLKSTVQTAIADFQADGGQVPSVNSSGAAQITTLVINPAGADLAAKITGDNTTAVNSKSLDDYIDLIAGGDYPVIQKPDSSNTNKTWTVTIDTNGSVSVKQTTSNS